MSTKNLKKQREAAAKLSRPKPIELPSGSWRCQVMVNGKRIDVIEDDPVAAHAKALAIKSGVVEEEKGERKGDIALKDAIQKYIDQRDKVLSPSTIRGYHVIMENRFPALMKKTVSKIDERDLQEAINAEAKAKSAKTIKNSIGLVVAVLGEYKTINTKRLRFPQRAKKEHPYLDGDQIVRLISACQGDIAEIPILLGVWLGMRRSEIFGLQWESIDFERSKISVDHSLVYDKDENPILKTAMKTETSNRILDCPQYIMKKLDEYQPVLERRTGAVFHMHPNTVYKNLEKICKSCDIPFVGVHGLRHTNASVMLSLGIVDKIAMARGGWSSKETMERIYQHLFDSDKQAADTAINDYFNELVSKTSHEITHDAEKGK